MFDNVKASLLQVKIPKNPRHGRSFDEYGTAFFFESGFALTNEHVVKGEDFEGEISVMHGGNNYPATVFAVHPQADVAIIHVPSLSHVASLPLHYTFFPLQHGYAIGHQGTDEPHATSGVVGRPSGSSALVPFDGHTSPGFSGGPVVDEFGVFAIVQGGNLPSGGIGGTSVIPLGFLKLWIDAFHKHLATSSTAGLTAGSPPTNPVSATPPNNSKFNFKLPEFGVK